MFSDEFGKPSVGNRQTIIGMPGRISKGCSLFPNLIIVVKDSKMVGLDFYRHKRTFGIALERNMLLIIGELKPKTIRDRIGQSLIKNRFEFVASCRSDTFYPPPMISASSIWGFSASDFKANFPARIVPG